MIYLCFHIPQQSMMSKGSISDFVGLICVSLHNKTPQKKEASLSKYSAIMLVQFTPHYRYSVLYVVYEYLCTL